MDGRQWEESVFLSATAIEGLEGVYPRLQVNRRSNGLLTVLLLPLLQVTVKLQPLHSDSALAPRPTNHGLREYDTVSSLFGSIKIIEPPGMFIAQSQRPWPQRK
jgi:hypothetical protein